MARIDVVREVSWSPEEAFSRVTDWDRHGEHVPLTTISRTQVGFVARTGLGPFGFEDPMEIVAWDPPRRCRLVKGGTWVRGWAEIRVEPTVAGSRVTWTEDLHVRGVPRVAARVEAAASARLFGRTLDGLLA